MSGLIVTGMHRSGTSLLARLLSTGGWNPGEVLLRGDDEEYYEDASFVALHRAWLDACTPAGAGHRDWGLSDGGEPDLGMVAGAADAVRGYAAMRGGESTRWLAKDPRAALFLDDWGSLADVRFVFVYRSPWDVVDSALRLGNADFCADPGLLRRAWLLHNRRLVAFARAHPARCTIVAAEALVTETAAVWALLAGAVGLAGAPPAGLVQGGKLVTRDRAHPIAELTRMLHPECADLLHELDELADLPRPMVVASRHGSAVVRGGELAPGTGVQVVVPCRDDGAFLDEALASVAAAAAATAEPVELTIVDDGSTDPETLRVLDALRRAEYQVVTTTGVGLPAARNVGMRASNTLAVLLLDSDNRVLPVLLAGVALLRADVADIVHGSWEEFGMRHGVVAPVEVSLDALLTGNTIDACALVRRSLLDDLHGYDETLPFWEDWDLWLRAAAAGARFQQPPEVTFRYLARDNSMGATVWANKAQRAEVCRKVLGSHTLAGEQLADVIAELHDVRHVVDVQWRAADERAAHAARHAADIDADRARLEAELGEVHRALAAASGAREREAVSAAAVLAEARKQHDDVAAQLAAMRARRSVRMADALAGRLARHPRLRRLAHPLRRALPTSRRRWPGTR